MRCVPLIQENMFDTYNISKTFQKHFLEDSKVIAYLEKSPNVTNLYSGGLVGGQEVFGVQTAYFLEYVLIYVSNRHDCFSDEEIYAWRTC